MFNMKTNKGHIMPRELIKFIDEVTEKEIPFDSWGVDRHLVPEIMDWVDGDWEKMRLLLNMIHERGVEHGIRGSMNLIYGYLSRARGVETKSPRRK